MCIPSGFTQAGRVGGGRLGVRSIGLGADVFMGMAIANAAVFSLWIWVVVFGLKSFETGFIDF